MISHKHKFIFIHIPKCAGSSIKDFYFEDAKLDWKKPNYELLYGWCPDRKIHLQHATPKQLIETHLISKEIWNSYFKFTFVRNPWDRAYSDYFWVKKDRKVRGSFKNYIRKKNQFNDLFTNKSNMNYRGDHLTKQSEFAADKNYKLDYIGKFETLNSDIKVINERLNIVTEFNKHSKQNNHKLQHYSQFYTNSNKRLVEKFYEIDIKKFNYVFEDLRKGRHSIKKIL